LHLKKLIRTHISACWEAKSTWLFGGRDAAVGGGGLSFSKLEQQGVKAGGQVEVAEVGEAKFEVIVDVMLDGGRLVYWYYEGKGEGGKMGNKTKKGRG